MKASLATFAVVAALTSIFVYSYCDVLHRCGCRGPWAGGDARCNVHEAHGPHCPWCEHPALGGITFTATLAAQGFGFAWTRKQGRSRTAAALVALLALPAAGIPVAALAWLPTDYPHFLVPDARARLGLPPGPLACVKPDTAASARPCCR